MKTPDERRTKASLWPTCAIISALVCLVAPTAVFGQPAGCTLVADERNPADKVLRCGEGLTIRTAPNTEFRLTGQEGGQPATGARLDAGALLIDFTPDAQRKNFQ